MNVTESMGVCGVLFADGRFIIGPTVYVRGYLIWDMRLVSHSLSGAIFVRYNAIQREVIQLASGSSSWAELDPDLLMVRLHRFIVHRLPLSAR